MADIEFYRDHRDVSMTLKTLFEYVDQIRRLELERDLVNRPDGGDLIIYVPPATINAVKTAMHRLSETRPTPEAEAIVSCATSPKRPDPEPVDPPLTPDPKPPKAPKPNDPDPPCRPGKPCIRLVELMRLMAEAAK